MQATSSKASSDCSAPPACARTSTATTSPPASRWRSRSTPQADKPTRFSAPLFSASAKTTPFAPATATLRHAAKAPRGEIRRYQAGHFDIYIGEHFEQVINDQLAFLQTNVPAA
jgi:hypothetical protein